jgi:Ion transport protein
LFIYIYSIVGMMYFGEVKRTANMNDYINFETFTSAFITMFTVATGDSWNLTMEAFSKDASPNYDCIYDPNYTQYMDNGYRTIGCGSKNGAFAFFVSFNFIVRLVFLKLFIAVILEGYLKT